MKLLRWLDQWNGKEDGQELAGVVGLSAGMVFGVALGFGIASGQMRAVLEVCLGR